MLKIQTKIIILGKKKRCKYCSSYKVSSILHRINTVEELLEPTMKVS